MDFDDDSLLSPQSLELLAQVQRDADRADAAHDHNMSVGAVIKLGKGIAEHCLKAVSRNRQLLVNEGALNSEIRNYLLAHGIAFRTGGTSGEDYLYQRTPSGDTIIERIERRREVDGVNSDLLIDGDQKRVELKTAATATPKAIPSDFFTKDLAHLRGEYLDELSYSTREGALRKNRKAEMALLVCDERQARSRPELERLLGDKSGMEANVIESNDGVTYLVSIRDYESRHILRSRRADEELSRFVVFLATPSLRE